MWLSMGGVMLCYWLCWLMRKTHTVYTQLDVYTEVYVCNFEVCQNCFFVCFFKVVLDEHWDLIIIHVFLHEL